MVQGQLADAAGDPIGDWIKLVPFVNVYDSQANSNYTNCTFDPIDDGNTEDDFFDPTDPARRFGPSSTCAPQYNFADQGSTEGPYSAANLGDASDGPGLEGSHGQGTWVEPQFDLSRFRARRMRLRFLTSGIKFGGAVTYEDAYSNPGFRDDGWFIDDVMVSDTLTEPAVVTVDTKDNSHLPPLYDVDGDGVFCDNCPDAHNPDQVDSDGDLLGDACDTCPQDSRNDADGDGFCCPEDNCCVHWNPDQADADEDGVGDPCDNCPSIANADQADVVHPDGTGDACDDPDGDGVYDREDNCVDLPNPAQENPDGDVWGSVCDNCPLWFNQNQVDHDGDGLGDGCDSCPTEPNGGDADQDGVDDACDNCPDLPNPDQDNSDNDPLGDACDNCPQTTQTTSASWNDADGDGLGNPCDSCPLGPFTNTESDPLVCVADNCPSHYNPSQDDWDGDGLGDACDPCPADPANDVDEDGHCADVDNCPSRLNPAQSSAARLSGDEDALRPGLVASPDGAWVVYGASEPKELYAAPTRSGWRVRLAGPLPPGASFGEGWGDRFDTIQITPDSSTVVYLADATESGPDELYSLPIGGGLPVKLNAPLLPGGYVQGDFLVSSDGTSVVFSALQATGGEWGLFSVPVHGGPATRLAGLAGFVLTPDGSTVVYTAEGELYAVSIGGGTATRLSRAAESGGAVRPALGYVQVSPDSTTAVYVQRIEALYRDEILAVGVAGGTPTLLDASIELGAVPKAITPDGSKLVYTMVAERPGTRELFQMPIDGGARVTLSEGLPDGREVVSRTIQLSADGAHVVYHANQDHPDLRELYGNSILGGTQVKLNRNDSGNVESDYRITADSARVVFMMEKSLYSVPIEGGNPVNFSSYASAPALSPDGSTLAYVGSYPPIGYDRLFVAPVAGGTKTELFAASEIGAIDDVEFADDAIVVFRSDRGSRTEVYAASLQPDTDGDGVIFACDCAVDDETVWDLPSEVRDLELSQSEVETILYWVPPARPGAVAPTYDTLRSELPDGFGSGAVCIESGDGADTIAYDAEIPGPGALYHYLVRARNACGAGPAGEGRVAVECPQARLR